MTFRYATRMDQVGPSIIREFARLTASPEIISFAGGLPAPELFPIEQLKEVAVRTLDKVGRLALQYSDTAGSPALRDKIAGRMRAMGVPATAESINILSGSQQGIEFAAKIFLDPGDVVVCERPTYLGAINAFHSYQAQFADVGLDDEGMIIDELVQVLETTAGCKLVYVVPDFQNPTGRTWSLERRQRFIEVANRYDLIVVEDHPYGALRYEGLPLPPIKALDTEERVLFLGTFSKIFCPGFRIGWITASQEVLAKFAVTKGNADLQTNSLAQAELNEFLDTYDLEAHIGKLRDLYRHRRDLMLDIMGRDLPSAVRFTRPLGGLFTWVELPDPADATELLSRAIARKVAFVPGTPFYARDARASTLRLNFSNTADDRMVEGMKVVIDVINRSLASPAGSVAGHPGGR
jgi:2-aminoadipate transaminase